MATRKTWFWIIGGACGTVVLLLLATAGAGIYFISRHVQAQPSTSVDALDAFDTVTRSFGGRRALYELDAQERPHLTTELSSIPSATVTPSALMVQAWNPEEQRLVRVTLPLWLLRLGPEHLRVSKHDGNFDFSRLSLDLAELERIGPALVLDYRNQDGVRVLLWTK